MALPFALPARLIELPGLSLRFVPVWQRNLLVWRKLAFASILGNIADPLLYMLALGYGHSWYALWILPLGFLVGLTFGAFGLVMTSLAPGYDFFTYFFTLVLTPGLLLSGVFFPVAQLPPALQTVSNLLPLKHAIDISRPLLRNEIPPGLVVHVAVLLAYACSAYYVALVLTRRRLLR